MKDLVRHAAHVLVTFAVTLAGMLYATHQPITKDLVVSMLPAAAVATLRALESRRTATNSGSKRAPASDPVRPG